MAECVYVYGDEVDNVAHVVDKHSTALKKQFSGVNTTHVGAIEWLLDSGGVHAWGGTGGLPVGGATWYVRAIADASLTMRTRMLAQLGGAVVVNSPQGVHLARDKALCAAALNSAGVATIPAFVCSPTPQLRRHVPLDEPFIIKPPSDFGGNSVELSTHAQLETTPDGTVLAQPYLREGRSDIRILVAGGSVLGAIRREAPEGQIRSNINTGGTAQKWLADEEKRRIAIRACEIIGLHIGAVDLFDTSNGVLVCEINSAPGLESMVEHYPDVYDRVAAAVRNAG